MHQVTRSNGKHQWSPTKGVISKYVSQFKNNVLSNTAYQGNCAGVDGSFRAWKYANCCNSATVSKLIEKEAEGVRWRRTSTERVYDFINASLVDMRLRIHDTLAA